jgi:predicted nucleotidyltransferase
MSLKEQLRAIAHHHNLAALYVFGSRAKEIATQVRKQSVEPHQTASDVDIGVQPAHGHRLSAQHRVRLAIALEDLLGVQRVDLVVLPEADPFLALDVIRGELLYCDDPDRQAEDELFVLRRAADVAHHARDRWHQILSGKSEIRHPRIHAKQVSALAQGH